MSTKNFDIQPVAGRIGAEIVDVDLSTNLSNDIISEIRKALVQYKVIFFRRQQLDINEHVAFGRRFGEVSTDHPSPSLPGHPEVIDLDYGKITTKTNVWHTDVTFIDRPPLGSILRTITVPAVGGDTIWANCVTAYQDLPDYLRSLVDQLWAVHGYAYDYTPAAVDLPADVKADPNVVTSMVYETLHPLVRVHPESGERGLFAGGYARQVRGLSTTESDDLIRLLQSYVIRPENTVRWRWQVGDVVFWDNRATQHYALADYDEQPRHLQRVTISGDIPVSIDGKRSETIKGNSSAYTLLTSTKGGGSWSVRQR